MNTLEQQKRLIIIKRIAEQRQAEKKAALVERNRQIQIAEMKRKNRIARNKMLAERKNRKDPLAALNVKEKENQNHWTDASKYAKKYYGEVKHETTRFDNEWD
jgi:hypothetical protein